MFEVFQLCEEHKPLDKTLSYLLHLIFRSSRPQAVCKKGVLKNFAKFTGKHIW